jgi:hypothetical protein
VAVVLWYALGGRAWLKSKPRAQKFFAAVEPVEIALYKKSETILLARLKMLLGATLAALTALGQIDLTPIMLFVPEQRQELVRALFNLLPLIITLVGLMDERLRRMTTKLIELVAIPDNVVEFNPLVAQAVAAADATKVEAVAAATEAKVA